MSTALADIDLAATPCPGCRAVGVLTVAYRLHTLPGPAKYALAGAMTKVAATSVPHLVHDDPACGLDLPPKGW